MIGIYEGRGPQPTSESSMPSEKRGAIEDSRAKGQGRERAGLLQARRPQRSEILKKLQPRSRSVCHWPTGPGAEPASPASLTTPTSSLASPEAHVLAMVVRRTANHSIHREALLRPSKSSRFPHDTRLELVPFHSTHRLLAAPLPPHYLPVADSVPPRRVVLVAGCPHC